jgi:hypothetical protein
MPEVLKTYSTGNTGLRGGSVVCNPQLVGGLSLSGDLDTPFSFATGYLLDRHLHLGISIQRPANCRKEATLFMNRLFEVFIGCLNFTGLLRHLDGPRQNWVGCARTPAAPR